ncbi:MAG: flagellar FliJ family protein [Spirochaetia bacterium]|nr:flagellar FliJ family protein [Spirochaetota bacterium]MCX8096907.1 flagellar FliJ family protein [Spirochaetota bacterium]MDW8112452.1 flagellar FliJ family protein [Spirochaetia bacterium]
MKRFSFRLQRVLEIKQKQRDIERQNLARKASEYNIEVAKANKLKDEKRNAIEDMKKNPSLENRQFVERYIILNERMQKYQSEDVRRKEVPFREAMSKYLKKDSEVKVIQKLKDKAYDDYSKGLMKEEYSEVDEIISRRLGKDE